MLKLDRLFAGACLALACAHSSAAQEPPKPSLAPPTAAPERIILNLTADPRSSMAVTWRSAPGSAPGKVQYAVAGDGPDFVRETTEISAVSRTESLAVEETSNLTADYHSAVITGLKPATRYAYRVGDGLRWSQWLQFSTAGEPGAPFSFIYMGDAQNDIASHWGRVVREAFREGPRAAFMIHAGDLINRHNSDREWGEWFAAGGAYMAETPSVATPGNHEYGRGTILSPQWRVQFTQPENGPPGVERLRETAFYADYQGMRVISVDAPVLHGVPEVREATLRWLEGVLANNPNRWTVITLHFPLFSSEPQRDNPRVRDALKPLIDKYRVDLVLQGHDHGYARGVVGPSATADGKATEGTVYVVSVAGPKMYPVGAVPWADRKAERTQLFQVLDVEESSLRYRAYTAAGRLYDAFELRKRPGRLNHVVNQIPANAPERLAP